jgi:hypothetical protein
VQYAVTCHAITVTNYRSTWFSVKINAIFNTFGSLIGYIGKFYLKDIFLNHNFEFLGRTVEKLSLQDTFFFQIINYQGFRKKDRLICIDFSSLGCKFKPQFKM